MTVRVLFARASLLVLVALVSSCDGSAVSAPKEGNGQATTAHEESSHLQVLLDPELTAETRSAITEIVSLHESVPLGADGARLQHTSRYGALIVAVDAEGRPRAEGITDGEILVLSAATTAQTLVHTIGGVNRATLTQLATREEYRSLERLVRKSSIAGASYYDDPELPRLIRAIMHGAAPSKVASQPVDGFSKLSVFPGLPGEIVISNTSLLAFNVEYGGTSTSIRAGGLAKVSGLTASEYEFLFDPFSGPALTTNAQNLERAALEVLLATLSPIGTDDELAECLQQAFGPVINDMLLSSDPLDTFDKGLKKARGPLWDCVLQYATKKGIEKKFLKKVLGGINTVVEVATLAYEKGPLVDDVIAWYRARPLNVLACKLDDGTYRIADGPSCSTRQRYFGTIAQTGAVTFSLNGSACTWSAYIDEVGFSIDTDGTPGQDGTFQILSSSSVGTQHETYQSAPDCGPPFTSTQQLHSYYGPTTITGTTISIDLTGSPTNLPGTTLRFTGTADATGSKITGTLTWQRVDQPADSGLNWTISAPIVLNKF